MVVSSILAMPLLFLESTEEKNENIAGSQKPNRKN